MARKSLWRIAGERRSASNRKFENADELWNACAAYFKWIEENPLLEAKAVSYQGETEIIELPKMRAMTLTGLQLFLGICSQVWINWKEERADLAPVQLAVEAAIHEQKFTGAAADLLNANIISRDLGLIDKQLQLQDPESLKLQAERQEAEAELTTLLAKLASEKRNGDI